MAERFDLLITGDGGGHTLPKEGLKALLRALVGLGYVNPVAESVAQSWVAVYCAPGTAAHTVFAQGEAPEAPAFTELCVWTGPREPLPYGEGEACFYLEFRGCLYNQLPGPFRRRVSQLTHIQPRVIVRPHVPDAGRRVVPENERPRSVERSKRGGAVGTLVEEF
jgi:hypothetical protein